MTTQSEKESSVKQLGHLPYGGCPNAVPFFLWSGLRDSLGSLSRSPTRTRPPKQPPAVSLLRNGLFEPRILINAKKKHRSASSFSWSGLRDSLGSLSRSPTRTRPPKQPPAVSLLRNGLFEPRILINAKKKHRSASSFSWSGLRDSNSLPPPWQGGALPDELNPHVFS